MSEGRIDKTQPFIFSADDTEDVSQDLATPVTEDYRYEFSRKFAPYVGFAYTGNYGQTATFTREEGGNPEDPRFIFGVRLWY